MIKTYVKSRGVSKDYCWLDGQQEIDKPPELPKFKVDVDDFALILQRQGDKLALLVNSLTSSKRLDSQNRKIRNFVLWVGDKADESCMRGLVIEALGEDEEPLGGRLAAQLDEMISSATTEPGFQVDFTRIETLTKQTSRLEGSEPSSSEGKIGNLSTLKADLRDELMRFSFPEGDGLLLVIVAPNVSETNLENHNVWRGLSNQVDSDEGWIPLKKNQSFLGIGNIGNILEAQSGRFRGEEWTSRKLVMLSGWLVASILVVVVIILITLNIQHQKELDELKENRNLTRENVQLREENENLAVQNKDLQEDNEKLNNKHSKLQKMITKEEELIKKYNTQNAQILEDIEQIREESKQLGLE
ncbi:hypothetical protein AY600_14460 [Phormidium willei BDU 130791]|nr:hypothetical protein AY600_14460 [Phormidium willei BDU 130791]